MSPEDKDQITAIVTASEQRTAGMLAASGQRTAEMFAASERRIAEVISAAKDETIAAMRDVQAEILRGIEACARGEFAHLRRLENSAAETNARLTALEERVVYLEIRQGCVPVRPPR